MERESRLGTRLDYHIKSGDSPSQLITGPGRGAKPSVAGAPSPGSRVLVAGSRILGRGRKQLGIMLRPETRMIFWSLDPKSDGPLLVSVGTVDNM